MWQKVVCITFTFARKRDKNALKMKTFQTEMAKSIILKVKKDKEAKKWQFINNTRHNYS